MKQKIQMCNEEEHQKWNRRSFLQALGFTGLGTMALANSSLTYAAGNKLTQALDSTETDNILVVLRLFGGNDGLNTVVPLNQYDLYANYRPTLKHAPSEMWNLSDDYAMPNQMSPLQGLWNDGAMKIVHSVGYKDLTQSHFKGTAVWAGAKEDNSIETGWMGRYFENKHPEYVFNPPEKPTAIQLGTLKNTTFDGEETRYNFSVASLSRLESIVNDGLAYEMKDLPDCLYGDRLKFVRGMYNSTYNYADVISEAYNSSTDYTGGNGYAKGGLHDGFSTPFGIVSRLIKGNLGTKVYTLTVSGFDTHSTQEALHDNLMKYMSDAISNFYEDLKQAGWADKVLVMVTSEFGRRVAENGSYGTDHGVAAPMLFFGEGLDGNGFIGEHGSLEQDKLYNGRDLQWHTDFKQAYATVLKEWMGVDEQLVDEVILDKQYESLPLFEEKTLSNSSFKAPVTAFASSVYYDETLATYIKINNHMTQHIVINVYDLNGRKLGAIVNRLLTSGTHKFDVKMLLKTDLPRGYYIYTVSTNSQNISRKLMVM